MAASGRNAADVPCVFASAHGDLSINDYMCGTLASDPTVLSPTKFHNSVHNAAVGYWTIGVGCMAASNSVVGLRDSFASACSKPQCNARPTTSRCCWWATTCPPWARSTSVTDSRGLLAVALVIAPATHRAHRGGARLVAAAAGASQPTRRRARRPPSRWPSTRWPTRYRCSNRWRTGRSEALACRCRPTLSLRLQLQLTQG
jgi:hypothetical protein